jgi:hypothetical protein
MHWWGMRLALPSQIPSLMKRCWGMRLVHPPLYKPHPPPLDLPAPPTNLLPALTIFHTSAACTRTYQHDHDHDHLYHEPLLTLIGDCCARGLSKALDIRDA